MMNSIKLTTIALLLCIGCKDSKNSEPIVTEDVDNVEVTSIDIQTLMEPTILNHYIDSIGLDQLIVKYGEDAETILDDLMWYDYQMTNKADSVGVPVKVFNQRKLKVKYGDAIFEHIQDTASGFVTLFYFDGKTIKEHDLLEMIDLLSAQ